MARDALYWRLWRKRHPRLASANAEKYRKRHIPYMKFKEHRLTQMQRDRMLQEQGGVCAICKGVDPSGKLVVDHDHACCPGQRSCGKCTRGLLCNACNKGLGHFRDNVAFINEAGAYLTRWVERTSLPRQ